MKKYILEKYILKKLRRIYFLIEKNNLNRNNLNEYIKNTKKTLDNKEIYMNYFCLNIQDNTLLSQETRNVFFKIELSYFDKKPTIHKVFEITSDAYNNLCQILNNEINFKEISIFNLIKLNKYLKLFQLELENKINKDKKELLNYFGF